MHLQTAPVETLPITTWNVSCTSELQTQAIHALEKGQLLFLPQLAFAVMPQEQRFISPDFSDMKAKNISYDGKTQQLKGAIGTPQELQQVAIMMARFSQQAEWLVRNMFPHYQEKLQIARTSFRPVEITHRKLSYRKDDRRLHVDAFPSTPNQGKRILRVFSNINPHGKARVWRVGEPFETVAQRFLPKISMPFPGSSACLQWFKITKGKRTRYDHIMLQLHNRMKKDNHYQQQAMQTQIHFQPATTWIVQTDQVSHAALSGQHLLEQTFYLPVNAMRDPLQSPLKILERLMGRELV